MADIRENTRIPLKKLDGFETLTPQEIKFILIFCQQIIENSYNLFGQKQNTQFKIRDFRENIFLLRKITTVTDYAEATKEPNLLISDILSFVEQIRTDLYENKNIQLDSNQKDRLKRMPSIFELVGLTIDDDKFRIKDLEVIEKNIGSTISRVTDFVIEILETTKLVTEEETAELADLKTEEERKEILKRAALEAISETEKEEIETGGDDQNQKPPQEKKEELKDKKTDFKAEFSQEFNLARLDPETKNYLQYLSIITINQALNRYFDDATLQQLGLKEIPTFDQLPLDVRQQLMTASFAQIENLLVAGKFDLADLIKNPSSRLSIASAASINLMMDVNAMHNLNQAVRQIANKDLSKKEEEQITQQKKEELEKFKKEIEEAKKKENLSQEESEKLLEKFKTSFFTLSEDQFIEELTKITKEAGRDSTGTDLLTRSNILPTIDTFIQEGFPAEFIENFDYRKFSFYFGDEIIDKKTFEEHEEEIKNLFISYYKSRRSYLGNNTREEVAWEKIDLEEAENIWADITTDKKSLEKHFKMMQYHRQLNFQYGGEEITAVLAGKKTDDPILQLYQEAQQSTYLANLKREFEEYLRTGSQQSYQQITVYYQFYFQQPAPTVLRMEDFNDIEAEFNPYDLYAIAANQDFGMDAFGQGADGLPALRGQYQGQGGLRQAIENSPIGQAGDMLAKEALRYGLRAGIDALSGGTAEAAFQAWDAAKKAIPILEELENEVLDKLLEWIKKYGPYILIGSIIVSLLPILGLLAIPLGIYFAIKNGWFGIGGGGNGIFSQKAGGTAIKTSATHGADNIALRNTSSINNSGITSASTTAQTTTATGSGGLGATAMATATQAVVATTAITAGAALFYRANLENAFLTHFPAIDPYTNTLTQKKSKYASLEKTAKIVDGCSSPESDGKKCENPDFPVTIKYEVEIKPKADYTIQITNIEDQIKFKQSEIGWEESEGRVPPTINDSISFGFNDFEEIEDPENLILEPGESLVLEYEIEDLSSDYNHTAIINTIDVKFYYENSFESGTDNVKSSARVCLGQCGMGEGCWPASGTIKQLPFGDWSHSPQPTNTIKGYSDAYDIANAPGTHIYAPFAGELCFVNCDSGWGCNFNLEFNGRRLKFAHLLDPGIPDGQCVQVEEGYLIGLMGSTGASTGPHLHYELDYQGAFYFPSSRDSELVEIVPETVQGNKPALLEDKVITCYE